MKRKFIEVLLVDCGGVPRIAVSACKDCPSVWGRRTSPKLPNRGCCWYKPDFYLPDVQRMLLSPDGIQTLNLLISLPMLTVEKYSLFLTPTIFPSEIKDSKEGISLCPLFKEQKGCMLPPQYRPYICNISVCPCITKKLPGYGQINRIVANYEKHFFQQQTKMQQILSSYGLDLINHWRESLELLQTIPATNFCTPEIQLQGFIDFAEYSDETKKKKRAL